MPPICRGVAAVEPQPTAWGGPRWPTTQLRQVRTTRHVLRGRSADTPRDEKRVGRAPRALGAVITTFRSPYRGVGAFEPRPTARGIAPRIGPQHNHAKCALRGACSVGGWPVLHGTKSARAVGHDIRARGSKPFESGAADLSRCWCGRASVDDVGRTAPPRWATTQPRQVPTTGRVLRGWSPDTPRDRKRTGRAPRDSGAVITNSRSPHRGVGAFEPRPTAWGIAPRIGPQHNHAKCALRGACSVGGDRYSAGQKARGPRATRFERGDYNLLKFARPTCLGVGAFEPRPTAWGGTRPALAHNTTTPSPHCAARVLRGRLADTQAIVTSD